MHGHTKFTNGGRHHGTHQRPTRRTFQPIYIKKVPYLLRRSAGAGRKVYQHGGKCSVRRNLKIGASYRDRDKESKRKEDRQGEKIKKYHNYTPLRASLVEIYKEVCHTEKIPPARPLKGKRGGGNRKEYCEYHRVRGHATNECFDLKNIIEKLVREGKLDRFLATRDDDQRKDEGMKIPNEQNDHLGHQKDTST